MSKELRSGPGMSVDAAAEMIESGTYGAAGAPAEPVAKEAQPHSGPGMSVDAAAEMIESGLNALNNEAPVKAPQSVSVPEFKPAAAVTFEGVEIPAEVMPELSALQADYGSIDLESVKKVNPGLYAALVIEIEQRGQAILRRAAEVNRARQQSAETMRVHHEQQTQQQMAKARQDLLMMVPEWRDTKVKEAETAEIVEYLLGQGYSQQEVYSVNDPRFVAMIRSVIKQQSKPRRERPREDPVAAEIKRRNLSPHSTELAAMKIERLLA
ncbi:MAG TPA: hypothetical protein PJ986_14765 [Gammaproteobacteria bacterium]|nr:hypothetical protein [Gammaproteobacteria bacterium]